MATVTYPASKTSNLYLTVSYGTDTLGGAIWSGRPDPKAPPPQLYLEYRSPDTSEIFYQLASDSRPYNPDFTVVTVTNQGRILRSGRYGNEPGTWTEAFVASHALNGVVYGNNVWIAVGKNNLVVKTTDGVTWTESAGAIPGAWWQWICFGKGRFVAAGYQTIPDPNNPGFNIDAGVIMYSDDDGVTWKKANSGTNKRLSSIAYSPELNVFVAVGRDGTIISVNGS